MSERAAPHSTTSTGELRSVVDRLIADGAVESAARHLAELWRIESSLSSAAFVIARFEAFRSKLPLVRYKLAIHRSFTVEPAVELLRAAAFVSRIDLMVCVGGFNAYAVEIFDPGSSVYRFGPDTMILAIQTRDVAPELWYEYANLAPEQTRSVVERVIRQFNDCLSAFRKHSPANVILHLLESPSIPAQGILDDQLDSSQRLTLQQINQDLRRLATAHRGVYVLDYDALIARVGHQQWQDDRKWLTVRLPVSASSLIHLVTEWLRFLHPLSGRVAKVLVVDLDNTLWGGIIGEDGMAGIQVGLEYPGAAFQALQRAILDLERRGVLLAVCSKNDAEDALDALDRHPGMLLRSRHFSALRINWADKVQNLVEIAAELNLGIDSLAFLDDNPVERQHVRELLPEVFVIDLPRDPLAYARVLREHPAFERLTLSEEDRLRSNYYVAYRQRAELQHRCYTVEEFYHSLRQELEVALVTPMTVPRVAQLTQKTNQWNLTTRRYTEQEIVEIAARPGWRVLSIRVRDRYADNGLVGVAITEDRDALCEIHDLLLSCRVIGRTVETGVLSCLVDSARARGLTRIQGRFVPTKRNAMVKDVYSTHGFSRVAASDRDSLWELDLTAQGVARPEWIKLTSQPEIFR